MSKKDDIRRLWSECFKHSPEYTDMYFSRVYADDGALTWRNSDGRVVSSLLTADYELLFHGSRTGLSYICAAATARKYRGRGFMSRLMLEAIDNAYGRGQTMCALIPAHDWLYFFFDRFGFTDVFLTDRQCYTSFHPFTTAAEYHDVSDQFAPEVVDAFIRFEEARGYGVVHSRRDFLNILDDLSFRNGGTFVAVGRDDAEVAAMAWAVDNGSFILVNELMGIDDDARTGAMKALRERFPDRPMTLLAPAIDHSHRRLHPRGMGRIVNVRQALSLIARTDPTWRCRVRVTDPLLAVNSHTFTVADGDCAITDGYNGHLDFDVPIEVFTSIVFSAPATGSILGFPSQRTHISLML